MIGRPFPRSFVLFVLAALIIGCSMPRLMWTFADRMAMSQIDEWLALEGEQREWARERIGTWLEEDLRHDLLPRYSAFIHRFADEAETGLDAPTVERHFAEADQLYEATLASLIPHAAAILAGLDDDQLDHLTARLAEANAEYEAEYLLDTPQERRDALGERFIAQVERWSGPLDAEQRQLIKARAAGLPDTAGEWYRYRRRMEAELLALIADDMGAAAIAAHLECWWIEQCGRSRDELARTEQLRVGLVAMVAELDEWLHPEQQIHALRQLRRRADQLEAIAAH